MKCINDQQEMLKKDYEAGIEIDECPECYSVWLDKGELEQIQECFHRDYTEELKKIPNDVVNAMRLAREKGKPIRTCPKCKMEMNRKEYGYCSQILIDCCLDCSGIWLDKGELQALEIFFERNSSMKGKINKGFFASLKKLFHIEE